MLEKKDFGNDAVVHSIVAANRTADVNGTAADLKDYDGCLIVVNLGATGDTLSSSIYVLLEVETSDDNSTFADAADNELSASVTGATTGTFAKIDDNAEDATTFTVAYLGGERYVRPVVNLVGTHTNGIPVSANIIRTRKQTG